MGSSSTRRLFHWVLAAHGHERASKLGIFALESNFALQGFNEITDWDVMSATATFSALLDNTVMDPPVGGNDTQANTQVGEIVGDQPIRGTKRKAKVVKEKKAATKREPKAC